MKYPQIKMGDLDVGASYPRVVCSVDNSFDAIRGAKNGADIIELRCDKIEPPTFQAIIDQVTKIRQQLKKSDKPIPILGTIRRSGDLGGWYRFNKNEVKRLNAFERIFPYVDAVDIEYDAPIAQDVIKLAKKKNLPVVLSYHNFAYTPKQKALEHIIEGMENLEGQILKVACMVNNPREFDSMQDFLLSYVKTGKKPISVIPLGDEGKPGRYFFPLLGSCFTYGCETREHAPGQPHVRALHLCLDLAKDTANNFPITYSARGCMDLLAIYNRLKKLSLSYIL